MNSPATAVTVVIPVWGAHVQYLPTALASVREQSGPAVEIVVVDNASEPPVADLGPHMRVVRAAERLGIGSARNLGLRHVRTNYVMFWDADDVLLPGVLSRMCSMLDEQPDVVAVTMDSVRWTPETGPGERWPWPRRVMYPLTRRRRLFSLIALLYNPFTTTGPALIRTEAVRDAGGFAEDIEVYEDWALSGSLAVRGRIVMLRETGRLYRVHDESLSFAHLHHPDQGEWLRRIRRRARRDPRVPLWIKALMPLVWVHHRQRERRRARSGVGAGYYETALGSVTSRPGDD